MQTGASVIATISEVGDKTAYVTGSLLAHNLAKGMSIEQAYEKSKPGDVGRAQVYKLFDGANMRGSDENANTLAAVRLLLVPVYEQLAFIHKRLTDINDTADRLKAEAVMFNVRRRNAWMLGFFLFCIPIVMMGPGMREVMGMHHLTANVVMVVLWGVAALCFMWGMGMLK